MFLQAFFVAFVVKENIYDPGLCVCYRFKEFYRVSFNLMITSWCQNNKNIPCAWPEKFCS